MRSRLVAFLLFVIVACAGLLAPAGDTRAHDTLPGTALLSTADLGAPDTPTDLPEVILSLATDAPSRHPVAGPVPPAAPKRVQPTLDGLRRPPRALSIA